MNRRRATLLITLLLLPASAWAQAQGPGARVVRMAVHPAAEPVPSLRHMLLPSLADQTGGNAAVLYERAALLGAQKDAGSRERVAKLLDTPLEQMSPDEARQAVAAYNDVMREVELGVHRRLTDWDLPLTEGYEMLLPELGELRNVARALALRARVEAASGRADAAIASLQAGLQLGRGVAQAPTLINGLVGVAIANLMLDRVQELQQRPETPNLYWALTALPRPLVSLRKGLEFESVALGWWKPALRDPEKAQLSPEGWRQAFLDLQRAAGAPNDLGLTGLALASYTDARKHLLAKGYTPQQVDAMPVLQVVAIYMMDGYRRVSDAQSRWFYVPYWQARPHLNAAEEELRRVGKQKDALLARLLLPALGRAYSNQVLLDRRVDALRCVEAVRLYAAANEGRLPAALDEVRMVPIPLDPATNLPFGYGLAGATAVLTAPPADDARPDTAMRYEITIAR
jgi:hypothetical protein